jgi:hypothetical protein
VAKEFAFIFVDVVRVAMVQAERSIFPDEARRKTTRI